MDQIANVANSMGKRYAAVCRTIQANHHLADLSVWYILIVQQTKLVLIKNVRIRALAPVDKMQTAEYLIITRYAAVDPALLEIHLPDVILNQVLICII